jgi:glycosyltransferase involved in cell wall biosynthesis
VRSGSRTLPKRKVLYVLHNHPATRPGGAEAYALELYKSMRSSEEFEPLLVARVGPGGTAKPLTHVAAPFSAIDDDPNQYFLYTETEDFDFFMRTYRVKSLYTMHIAEFIRAYKPDVVHFQHTHFIGFDMITLIRRMLPEVPLLYTLHEFLPICHADGQMVRTMDQSLCLKASPRRCNECFPDWIPQYFFLRDRLVKSHLSSIDMFLCPSNFLLERYADWGIPREKLRFEDYGRVPQERFEAPIESRPRTRLGFFGQISPVKGVDTLLEAMKLLAERAPDVHLYLHGANIDILRPEARVQIDEALEAIGNNVTFTGPYGPSDVPRLMAEVDWVVVPSRWWENSPLVIQEAFMHGRPVICSGIGGMAEKVAHGVNGLHFNVSDPGSLAETVRIAATTPGLWEQLRDGIQPIFGMDEHIANLTTIYDQLIASRRGEAPREDPALARATA